MRRQTVIVTALLGSAAVLALTGATFAGQSTRSPARASAVPFASHPAVQGRLSIAKLLTQPPRFQGPRLDEQTKEFEIAAKSLGPGVRPAVKRLVLDGSDALKLDRLGRATPLEGKALPSLKGLGTGTRVGRATVPRTVQATAATRAGTDFTFFRNQSISIAETSSGKNEPSVGNDRDVIFYTGNKYAAVSVDDGISFRYVDPFLLDDANGDGTVSSSEQTDGGFCCDQLVNASDEGGNELVVWLMQYYADDAGSTIRLATYGGKSDLATPEDTNRRCIYDFKAADFGYSGKVWMDFSTMQNSDKWLYGTINVYSLPADDTAKLQGSAVWRIKLDDMTDGNCTLENGFQSLKTGDYGDQLVQGAGSTMYWGTHADNANSEIRIYTATDSSTSVDVTDQDITNYHTGTEASCPTPDGNNPCKNMGGRILTGWTGNGKVGWFWNVAQGDGYSFPHVQGAIFRTSDLKLQEEPIIYNDSYAWGWPAMGVNNRGDVAGTIYRIGGGEYPRARAFIVDEVDPSWSSLTMHGIASSTDTVDEDVYGDYGTTVRFDGCSNTWQAGVFTHISNDYFSSSQPRYVWFGRERDGCADVVVEKLAHLFDSTNGILWIGDTTRNVGSSSASATKTRYYLSKDTVQSDSDILLAEAHDTPSIAASDSDALLVKALLPAGTGFGTYNLIACADQPDTVTEVTNTNNCTVDGSTLTVKAKIGRTTPVITTVKPGTVTRIRPTSTVTLPTTTREAVTPPTRTVIRPATTTVTRRPPGGRPATTTITRQPPGRRPLPGGRPGAAKPAQG